MPLSLRSPLPSKAKTCSKRCAELAQNLDPDLDLSAGVAKYNHRQIQVGGSTDTPKQKFNPLRSSAHSALLILCNLTSTQPQSTALSSLILNRLLQLHKSSKPHPMPPQHPAMSNAQTQDAQVSKRPNRSDHENITANATLIWLREGPSFDFDVDVETDDFENHQAFLSVIRPDTRGRLSRIPLMMTVLHNSEERTMRDLDKTLKDMVNRGVKKEVQLHEYEKFNMKKALKLINDIGA